LRGDQQEIHTLRGGHVAVPHVEPVAEEQRLARCEVRPDVVGIQRPLDGVRRLDRNDIRFRGGLGRGTDRQALFLGLGTGLGPFRQADPHIHPGIPQAQRVGVALTAVPDHRNLAVLHDAEIGVVVVKHFGWHECCLLPFRNWLLVDYWCCLAELAVIERGPLPTATMPDCTSSRTPYGSSIRSNALILSPFPVASIVNASGETSTTFAWNICTVSST